MSQVTSEMGSAGQEQISNYTEEMFLSSILERMKHKHKKLTIEPRPLSTLDS